MNRRPIAALNRRKFILASAGAGLVLSGTPLLVLAQGGTNKPQPPGLEL